MFCSFANPLLPPFLGGNGLFGQTIKVVVAFYSNLEPKIENFLFHHKLFPLPEGENKATFPHFCKVKGNIEQKEKEKSDAPSPRFPSSLPPEAIFQKMIFRSGRVGWEGKQGE